MSIKFRSLLLVSNLLLIGCYVFKPQYNESDAGSTWLQTKNKAEKLRSESRFSEAEAAYAKTIELLGLNEETKYQNVAYTSYAQLLAKRGKFDQAVKVGKRSALLCEQNIIGPGRCADISRTWFDLAEIQQEYGDVTGAWSSIENCIKWATKFVEEWPNNAGYRVTAENEAKSKYYISLGNYVPALECAQYLLDYYVKERSHRIDYIGKGKIMVGTAFYYQGEYEKAQSYFSEALQEPSLGFPDYVVDALTMLGKVDYQTADCDTALTNFQKALKIQQREDFLTKDEEADTYGRIAAVQIHQNKMTEARSSINTGLQLRDESGTNGHPGYADLLRQSANLYAMENNMTSATACLLKAMDVLDHSVLPTHPRISSTLVALVSSYMLTGETEKELTLKNRMQTMIQKPLGPWKEDFLDTALLYADLLAKSGKTQAAEYVKQLYEQQEAKL